MKKTLILFISVLTFLSCANKSEHSKEDFLGIWNDYTQGLNNETHFYQDSVVLYDLFREGVTARWKIDTGKIHFSYIELPPDVEDPNWTLNYRLSESKDSLFLSHEGDDYEMLMIKVEDYWTHFQKIIDLKIEIAENEVHQSLTQMKSSNPTLYIGWKNHQLQLRVDRNSKNTNDIGDLGLGLFQAYEETEYDSIYPLAIVIDKNINQKSIDSIKGTVQKIFNNKVAFFNVYKPTFTDDNYGRIRPASLNIEYDWKWYGQWAD